MEPPKRYFIYCNDGVERYGAVRSTESMIEYSRQDLIDILCEKNGHKTCTVIAKMFDVTGYGIGVAKIIKPHIVTDMINRLCALNIDPFYEGMCIVMPNGNFTEIAAIRNRKNLV